MATKYHGRNRLSTPSFARIKEFVSDRTRREELSFEEFEQELHRLVSAWESELVARELASYDEDAPQVEVEGKVYRRKMESTKEYHGLAGTFEISRHLYVPLGDEGKAICPLELRAGIVAGAWTPMAARVMAHAVAISTPDEAAKLFREIGGLTPSASSLDRLPKHLSERWEAKREEFEAELRSQEEVPEEAVAVSVAIDGVQVPMKDGDRAGKRNQEDKRPQGPAGYREVGCGTITFHGLEGEPLKTIRYARGPEAKKVALKGELVAELRAILGTRPGLEIVGLSDGAPDHWEFLDSLPQLLNLEEDEIRKAVDAFHVFERVKRALDAYHGEGTAESKAAFEQYRVWMREYPDGVRRVLRALRYRRDHSRGATKKAIECEIRYIEQRVHLMRYKELLDDQLPIGSGLVEAACKTLATERVKRSGMSWGEKGLQAILTLRSLLQSDRWERAWPLLADQYKVQVTPRRAA